MRFRYHVATEWAMDRIDDSDLSDAEWALIAHHFEPQDPRGIKPIHPMRCIVKAILYLNKTGAQWRMLPKDYPPWKTVDDHYRRWNARGIWETALDDLLESIEKKRQKCHSELRYCRFAKYQDPLEQRRTRH